MSTWIWVIVIVGLWLFSLRILWEVVDNSWISSINQIRKDEYKKGVAGERVEAVRANVGKWVCNPATGSTEFIYSCDFINSEIKEG